MKRKFSRSCQKGGRCLVDVIIGEYAIKSDGFARRDILHDLASLDLTPRQVSYRLNQLVKEGTLTLTGTGRTAKYVITNRPVGMTHRMNLNPVPFEAIKTGKKSVEMRLNDEKRKWMQVGDFIIFTHTETKEEMLAKIVDKSVYKNFEELYANHDKTTIGYSADDVAKPEDMLEYYSKENIEKYGALAITVALVEDKT